MSMQEFTNIPDNKKPFLRQTRLDTNIPIEYRINCTYLENITNENMIIDSSCNILLQARNKHVRVNNKMGIGIDPSSAYNLHVLGNTCISGDIITDGNIVPLYNSSNLGSVSTRWANVFVDDLSINTINGLPYVGGGNGSNIDLTRITNNIVPFFSNLYKLGDISNIWSNAYINDISATNISVSGNIILNVSGSNITNINKLTATISNNYITTTHRIYQQISGDISWTSVNGYYGLAKDAYPGLNPYSSGAKAVQTWTKRTTYPNDSSTWSSICWSPKLGLFVAVASSGTKRVMTSKNGIVWSTVDLSNNNTQLTSVCWSPQLEIFVAVFANNTTDTTANKVVTSSNGTTWIERANGVISNGWTSVCWSAELSLFVAVANAGTNPRVMYSSDGTIWNSITSGVNNDNNWNSICWSPELGIFVAVAWNNSNRVMTSNNGKDWTSLSVGTLIAPYSICWSAQLGIFVATGDGSFTNRVMISSNGKNWILRPALNATWSNVCWSPQLGIFVAVSNTNGLEIRMMYSYDGLNWILIPNIEFQNWTSICWSSELGIFAVVGSLAEPAYFNRKVMTSSLQGRPPTSYNVFDSSFNAIDESGNWTFSAIDISSNLNPSLPNKGTLGLSNKPWGNAYIRDISASNIEISGNILPLRDISSDLGSITKQWRNIFAHDLSVNSINGQIYNANTIVDLSINHNALRSRVNDLSSVLSGNITRLNTIDSSFGNVYTKLQIDNSFTNVYTKLQVDNSFVTKTLFELSLNNVSRSINSYRDFSVNFIEISSSIIPLFVGRSNLGSAFRRWNNVFVNDLSVNTINGLPYIQGGGGGGGSTIDLTTISSDIIPSNTNTFKLGDISKTWSNAYINDISASNISISGNIIFSVSGGAITNINKLSATISNNYITTTHRIYQNINSDISWALVNGYYGLAKDAYIGLNPYSSGEKVLSTTNISSWTLRTIPVDLLSMQVSSVCWSPNLGLFVAVVADSSYGAYNYASNLTVSKAMYSYDGINWALGSMNTTLRSGLWKSVCWSAECGLFVAVASGNLVFVNNEFLDNSNSKIMTSQNGINWTEQSSPILAHDSYWSSVCWSREVGLFVAVAVFGTYKIITSSNGISWTIRSILDPNEAILSFKSVCWSAQLGIFVAPEYANSTGVITSKDGITWIKNNYLNSELNTNTWLSICWSPQLGIFVAVANAGTYRIMTSFDGIIWNPVYAIVQTLFFVDWIPDLKLFIALGVDSVGNVANVLTSVDGINWRPSVVPSSGGWLGSCWSPELGIVVAIAGGQLDEYSGSSKLMTSSLKGRPPTSYNVFDSCFNRIDESGNWTFANINVRSNILPLDNSSSDLGSGTKRWRNIYVNDLSVNTINGQPYSAGTAIVLTSVSGNIIPSSDNQFKLGDVSRNWSNAYIRDISVSNIDVSVNLNPSPTTIRTIESGSGATTTLTNATYRYYIYTTVGSFTFTHVENTKVDVLIVGGGGGGGSAIGGGGGGGGVVHLTGVTISGGVSYPVIVGAGGASETNGNPSSVFGAVAAGGGRGGGPFNNGSYTDNGLAGGSGGGASVSYSMVISIGGVSSGSSLGSNIGTIYGNKGGNMTAVFNGSSLNLRCAGGGGAGGAALDTNPYITGSSSQTSPGSGGVGILNTMYLEQNYYWGGGGGGSGFENRDGGWGGLGGGGGGSRNITGTGVGGTGGGSALTPGANGGSAHDIAGGAGGANTGGGGGGGTHSTGPGGAGGSGIVIIRERLLAYSTNTSIGSNIKPWNNAYINTLTINSLKIGEINTLDVINSLLTRISALENRISNSVYKIEHIRWFNTYNSSNPFRRTNFDGTAWNTLGGDLPAIFFKKANTKIAIKTSFSYDANGFNSDYLDAKLSIYKANNFIIEGTVVRQVWNGANGGGTRSGTITDCCVFMNTAPLIAIENTLTVKLEIANNGLDDTLILNPGYFEIIHLYA